MNLRVLAGSWFPESGRLLGQDLNRSEGTDQQKSEKRKHVQASELFH